MTAECYIYATPSIGKETTFLLDKVRKGIPTLISKAVYTSTFKLLRHWMLSSKTFHNARDFLGTIIKDLQKDKNSTHS